MCFEGEVDISFILMITQSGSLSAVEAFHFSKDISRGFAINHDDNSNILKAKYFMKNIFFQVERRLTRYNLRSLILMVENPIQIMFQKKRRFHDLDFECEILFKLFSSL